MSIAAINAVGESDVKPSGRRYVLLCLADRADEKWSCYPSVKQIAAWTGQGDKTVRDHLDALERDGIISRVRSRRQDGTLSRYRFIIHSEQLRPNEDDCNQRRISPVADFASGENFHSPAADFAAHKPPIEPPLRDNNSAGARDVSRSHSKPKPKTPSKGGYIDPDWRPGEAGLAYATEHGLSAERASHEAERFRDYWLQQDGARARKRDWSAAWREWVRRAVKPAPGLQQPGGTAPGGARPSPHQARADAFRSVAAEFDAARRWSDEIEPDGGEGGGVVVPLRRTIEGS